MRRRHLCAVVLLLTVGCSSADKADDAGAEQDEADDEASDAGGGADGWDSGMVEDGAEGYTWWRLDADLQVAGGDLAADGVVLRAGLLDAVGSELCTVEGIPAEATPFFTMPDELIFTWWALSGITWDGGDCASDSDLSLLPVSLSFGVGALHPEIVAVLDGMPEAAAGASGGLNGAYAQLAEGGTIYVFGAVGPGEAWAGGGEPATQAPLADGTWELRGAYGFPL
jgi:hypothetical protein